MYGYEYENGGKQLVGWPGFSPLLDLCGHVIAFLDCSGLLMRPCFPLDSCIVSIIAGVAFTNKKLNKKLSINFHVATLCNLFFLVFKWVVMARY